MGANSLNNVHGVERVRILAQRATIPSKGFCGLKPHIFRYFKIVYSNVYICVYTLYILYIYFLPRMLEINHMMQLFPIYFYEFLCILCTSAGPQRPAHGTLSSQVATHLRTDRVCRVLGRSWIRTQDCWFAVRCATFEPPLLLMQLMQLWLCVSFRVC